MGVGCAQRPWTNVATCLSQIKKQGKCAQTGARVCEQRQWLPHCTGDEDRRCRAYTLVRDLGSLCPFERWSPLALRQYPSIAMATVRESEGVYAYVCCARTARERGEGGGAFLSL